MYKEVIREYAEENNKLRAERDYLLMNSNPTATELRRVRRAWKKDRDENAKLRELVRDMWTCIGEGEWDCSNCPRYDRCDEGVSEFVRRMRELGLDGDE